MSNDEAHEVLEQLRQGRHVNINWRGFDGHYAAHLWHTSAEGFLLTLNRTPLGTGAQGNSVSCACLREDDVLEFLMEYGPQVSESVKSV